MFKKKGSIVPRYLCESIERKAQHLVKFGCDVEIVGRTVTAKSNGNVIVIPWQKHVLKKKRQRTVKGFKMKGVSVKGLQLTTAIDFPSFSL